MFISNQNMILNRRQHKSEKNKMK